MLQKSGKSAVTSVLIKNDRFYLHRLMPLLCFIIFSIYLLPAHSLTQGCPFTHRCDGTGPCGGECYTICVHDLSCEQVEICPIVDCPDGQIQNPITCLCEGGIIEIPECDAGYYYDGNACRACPQEIGQPPATSPGGIGDITSCYIPVGVAHGDTTGMFEYTRTCHYSL